MDTSSLRYLEGRKFCVVLVKEVPDDPNRARIQCIHGRASVDQEGLRLIDPNGVQFPVPNTALNNILPSDGTEILKDAEYYVMVKLHPDLDFLDSSNPSEDIDV